MADPVYNGKWQRIRIAILQRDGYRCQLHLPGCTHQATHVDHIQDWRHGGAWWDPANLRAACAHCNIAQRNQRHAARQRNQHNQTSRNW